MQYPAAQAAPGTPLLERWRAAEAAADLASHDLFNATIAFAQGHGCAPSQRQRDDARELRLRANTLFKLAILFGPSAGEVRAAAWHGDEPPGSRESGCAPGDQQGRWAP
jgi:hypothetical protein